MYNYISGKQLVRPPLKQFWAKFKALIWKIMTGSLGVGLGRWFFGAVTIICIDTAWRPNWYISVHFRIDSVSVVTESSQPYLGDYSATRTYWSMRMPAVAPRKMGVFFRASPGTWVLASSRHVISGPASAEGLSSYDVNPLPVMDSKSTS